MCVCEVSRKTDNLYDLCKKGKNLVKIIIFNTDFCPFYTCHTQQGDFPLKYFVSA
jgi:N6-adenosine-specific RNA methylase IME4